jgi:YHS domain-containing protein
MEVFVNRAMRILILTAALTFAVGTVFLFSQGKKGQVQDPVCQLWVDKSKDLSYTHKGETYYFCSAKDMNLFKENPAKYLPKK